MEPGRVLIWIKGGREGLVAGGLVEYECGCLVGGTAEPPRCGTNACCRNILAPDGRYGSAWGYKYPPSCRGCWIEFNDLKSKISLEALGSGPAGMA